jgi:hypothetical protein
MSGIKNGKISGYNHLSPMLTTEGIMTSRTLPDGLPRIGGMATMPSRAHTLHIALERILPQVDRLFLYLDRYESIPERIAAYPNIIPVLPKDIGEFLGAGKFVGLQLIHEPCLYFCFDDDILYPPRYVEHMATALYRYSYRAIVGMHATILKPPYLSYVRDRFVWHFMSGLTVDCMVDELGTGTLAFHSDYFRIDPREWPHHDMCDLLLAIDAVRQGLPRISIRRPSKYLLPIEQDQGDSSWTSAKKDDSRQTAIMRQAIEDHPFRWCGYGINNH